MPPFLFCPGITPVSSGASGVAMKTQETQGNTRYCGKYEENRTAKTFSVSINAARNTETKKVRNSAPVFLVVALSHLPSSATLSWKNAGSFSLCRGITPVSSGASGVAMETQETRTQSVNGTNGMLHEAKVDRHFSKTVNSFWFESQQCHGYL
ncbi:hypothetical protein CEXT_758861 [Caerostris extrusa]|uniref:Uncharacterized protein n=1 Tax=Caerostris extrusa TaxID=172846 RepID=A0AAV4X457_CAEEX|nr:hypothetical protein CEXT_758861 [Caerostris extrusa]